MTTTRPVIKELMRLLAFRQTYGRPCFVKWTRTHAALIVPHLTNGPDGPYSYLRGFHRSTIEEASLCGFITLGSTRVIVPNYASGPGIWANTPEHEGRTIALRDGNR